MATVYKTDVDNIAATYLKNNVNSMGIYRSGQTPMYTNQSGVGSFDTDPAASHPSRFLSGTTFPVPVRDLMIALASSYSNIGVGTYGMHSSDSTKGTEWVQGAGSGWFALAGFNNGVGSSLGGVSPPAGPLTQQQIIQLYQYGWNVLSTRMGMQAVDLTVCHSSCHTSCHGSRGRR
jgi:hypothetical protein